MIGKNEKGSALVYVLLISTIIMIVVPIIFNMITNTSSAISRSSYEKKATNLAVSGMQSYINNQDILLDRSLYGKSIVNLSSDISLNYFQFAVLKTQPAEIGNMLDYDSFITAKNNNQAYTVIITCIAGDTNNNNIKDADEPYFFEKKLVYDATQTPIFETAQPTISPLPLTGEEVVSGSAEENSVVTISLSDGYVATGIANINPNGSGLASYSIAVRALITDEIVTATAKAQGKTISKPTTATVTVAQETAIPTISPLPIAEETYVKGVAEQNAIITVIFSDGKTYKGIANLEPDGAGKAKYSITLQDPATLQNRSLVADEIIYVTAQAPRKTVSKRASAKVYPKTTTSNPNDDGLVLIVDPVDGTTTYQEISNEIVTPTESIIVTSSVGTFTSNENINFQGQEIIIQPNVTLIASDNQGTDVGVNLSATNGSINMQNVTLQDNAQKSFSMISLKSATADINITGSKLTAVRDILIEAAGNIYANNSELNSIHSQAIITINLSTNVGMLYVDGAFFNKNVTTNIPLNKICGSLKPTSGTIHGVRNFGTCPPY